MIVLENRQVVLMMSPPRQEYRGLALIHTYDENDENHVIKDPLDCQKKALVKHEARRMHDVLRRCFRYS